MKRIAQLKQALALALILSGMNSVAAEGVQQLFGMSAESFCRTMGINKPLHRSSGKLLLTVILSEDKANILHACRTDDLVRTITPLLENSSSKAKVLKFKKDKPLTLQEKAVLKAIQEAFLDNRILSFMVSFDRYGQPEISTLDDVLNFLKDEKLPTLGSRAKRMAWNLSYFVIDGAHFTWSSFLVLCSLAKASAPYVREASSYILDKTLDALTRCLIRKGKSQGPIIVEPDDFNYDGSVWLDDEAGSSLIIEELDEEDDSDEDDEECFLEIEDGEED